MSESGGHWKNLAEAQKLSQSLLIPGVIETDVKRNNPVDRVPVAQAAGAGLSIKFVKEKTVLDDNVQMVAIGEQLNWSEDVEYDTGEIELKTCYIQRKLDKFVRDIYGTFNNYRATVLLESEKALKRRIGDWMVYGDNTYSAGNKEWDGLHAYAAAAGLTPGVAPYLDLNIDENGALSLENLRALCDAMKVGVDELWLPFTIARKLDAAYQEKGFAGLNTSTAGTMAMLSYGWNEAGKRMMFWDAIPLVKTDYLAKEQDGTGTGATSDARAKWSSGTVTYSLFAVKYGQVMNKEPGFCFGYGGTEGAGDLYALTNFPNLEDYNAEGMRLVTMGALLLSNNFSIGRIFDIQDAAVLV
jgi:hypothetical protein